MIHLLVRTSVWKSWPLCTVMLGGRVERLRHPYDERQDQADADSQRDYARGPN